MSENYGLWHGIVYRCKGDIHCNNCGYRDRIFMDPIIKKFALSRVAFQEITHQGGLDIRGRDIPGYGPRADVKYGCKRWCSVYGLGSQTAFLRKHAKLKNISRLSTSVRAMV
jgi:ribosomal protein S14